MENMIKAKAGNEKLLIRFGGLAFSWVLILFFIVILALVLIVSKESEQKPNILLIMCDDMGFSDLGSFGGEIHTPNIDALAENGLRFTNIKNTSRCCPSRASLMTGRYAHAVGMGWMTAVDEHRAGYRGQLSGDVPTIAEILKPHGYKNYLCGKWHLLVDGAFKTYAEPNGNWPAQRGFDRSFGILAGGGGYYDPTSLFEDLEYIKDLPEDFYMTHAITEKAVEFIHEHPVEEPMFMYLAHYAPHRPLEAPEERIKQCEERYKVGYDVLREKRFERMKEQGIILTHRELPIHQDGYKEPRPSWDSLDEKTRQEWVTEMATYAAMIEMVDDGIGEMVDALKSREMVENTVIIFLSDNGATREGGDISQYAADLSNTPYRNYKAQVHHGGISTPFIIHCPKRFGRHNGTIRNTLGHIIDVCPTILDIAGINYPSTFKNKPIPPPDGTSLLPALTSDGLGERDLFFEHQTSCAVISGNWKLVRGHKDSGWLLFDLSTDPFEQDDLARQHPERVKALDKRWNRWAEQNNVLPFSDVLGWTKRIKYYKAKNLDQDGID